MSKRLTHEEFLDRLPDRIKEDFIIKNEYITSKERIILEDSLGILYSSQPFELLSGRYPSILNAINKTDALSKIIKDKLPELTIISEYKGHTEKILVEDALGIVYRSTPAELKNGKSPLLLSAINIDEAFGIKASNIHNSLYDYSKVSYISNRDKIKIICKIHGEFLQTPGAHLSGQGCPICGAAYRATSLIKSQEKFIEECINTHENEYDYSKVIYKNSKIKIEVICKRHGSFFPTANNHLSGSKCPKCSREAHTHLGYNKQQWVKMFKKAKGVKSPIVYVVKVYDKVSDEQFIKIGRSYRSVKKRFGISINKRFPYNYEVLSIVEGNPDFIFSLEKKLHKDFKEYKYTPLKEFKGSTECFSINVLKYIKYEN